MVDGLRILTARHDGDTVSVVLPHRQLVGQEYREQLEHDYRRLSESGVAVVRLDLRAVECIDGAFMSLLLRFRQSLTAGGGRLTVQVSPNLATIFRLTKLDHLIEVVGEPLGARALNSAEPDPVPPRG